MTQPAFEPESGVLRPKMIKYKAKILRVNSSHEDDVTVQVNDMILTCCVENCPYLLLRGDECLVTFSMDSVEAAEQSGTKETGYRNIGNTYAYALKGKLYKGILDAGFKIRHESLTSDYSHLNEKYVYLSTERLKIEFLAA